MLRGNLAPDGAVIKLSAASPHLLQHCGRAVVFESIEDFHARINDEAARYRWELHHGSQELRPARLSGHG